MLKEKWLIFVSLLLIILGAAFSYMIIGQDNTGRPDPVLVNRIVKYAEENWGTFAAGDGAVLAYPFAVLDADNILIYQSEADTSASLNEAVKNQNLIMDVYNGNRFLGKVLINTRQQVAIQEKLNRVSLIIFLTCSILAVITLLCFFYLNHKLLKPFRQMKEFARNIAAGNLDIPLVMDENNLFGPFTESFDIMREELAKARYQEAMADKSKKELVASLSHDIKTPLTAIKLISELLEVTAAGNDREKIHTIYEKADQIDQLITNLFHASLEELGQLSVSPFETESCKLGEMIRKADFYNQTTISTIPDCLLKIDPLRMQQIFDNIINNSLKYAGTAIDITCAPAGELMMVTVKDYGPGVPEDELLLLFQKYYRGSNAVDDKKDGSGIGLYLCSYLIEQMGGGIRCYNHKTGFAVELLLPLS